MSRPVSVVHEPGVRYPDTTARYGPDPAFVEAPRRPGAALNPAYGMVRRALLDAGCDAGRAGTAAWNPLGDFVAAGRRIHVLPNFVMQRRGFEPDERTFFAKVTHAAVLQPVLDYAILAAGSADLVSIGNAPIQGCDYHRIVAETGLRELLAADYAPRGHTVTLVDLRGLHATFTRAGALRSRSETAEPVVSIDLGADSLLEPLYARGGAAPRFRVGDYPGSATAAFHGPGRHVYVINRRVLDADLIVSVPKLKAHEKVGLTCSLKGTVGTIARKECLAHHRLGGPGQGGDEYPRDLLAARLTSGLLEYVSNQPISPWSNALRVVATTAFRAFRKLAPGTMGGSWAGNDTAWRMALDIARIMLYATPDGRMADTPQRRHVAVIDGIVSGMRDGPLHPTPRDTGAVLFGDDACLLDWTCALVCGWDPARIPLLRESFALPRWPLTTARTRDLSVRLNGAAIPPAELPRRFSPPHVPPAGWRVHLGV